MASLVDGIRQCEQRLQEGVADAEAFLELSQGQASAPNVEDTCYSFVSSPTQHAAPWRL